MNEKQRRREIIDELTKKLLAIAEKKVRQRDERQQEVRVVADPMAKFMTATAFTEFPVLGKMTAEQKKEFEELTNDMAICFLLQTSSLAAGEPDTSDPDIKKSTLIPQLIRLFSLTPLTQPASTADSEPADEIALKVQRAFRLESEDQANERRVKDRVARHFTDIALAKYPELKDMSADQIRDLGKLVNGMAMLYATEAGRFAFRAENEVPRRKNNRKPVRQNRRS